MALKQYELPEEKVLAYLKHSKNVLLLEPNYRRQYLPLALAKIASYIKHHGGAVTFSRSPNADPGPSGKFDLICITTIFTSDSKIVIRAIKECKKDMFLHGVPIIVGGIYASLMPEHIYSNTGIKSFVGYSKELDRWAPDYSIDWKTKPPWDDAMLVFTTRGCPNKCGYCMVWRMEPDFYIQENWEEAITGNDKTMAIVSDNNFLAAPIEHIKSVVDILCKCNKKVLFNNAVDVKLLTEEKADALARLKYQGDGRQGLRFAFDRMGDDGHYQRACELMIKKLNRKNLGSVGLTYILFNFDDTPQEAYYRATQAWQYRSFPYLMMYRPLDKLSKADPFTGKYWTPKLARAFKTWGEMYGFNVGDKTFESWAKSDKSKVKLTAEDWEKWHYKRT